MKNMGYQNSKWTDEDEEKVIEIIESYRRKTGDLWAEYILAALWDEGYTLERRTDNVQRQPSKPGKIYKYQDGEIKLSPDAEVSDNTVTVVSDGVQYPPPVLQFNNNGPLSNPINAKYEVINQDELWKRLIDDYDTADRESYGYATLIKTLKSKYTIIPKQ